MTYLGYVVAAYAVFVVVMLWGLLRCSRSGRLSEDHSRQTSLLLL